MFIFITSVLVVSFIALCFFKKRFWENRYLVLFISGCVAVVATLTTNYATRGNLDTNIETIWKVPIQVMALNQAVIDSNSFMTLDKELGFSDHLHSGDTTKAPTYSRHIFYYNDGLRVGFANDDDLKSKDMDYVYILPSEADTVAYFSKIRQHYADRESKWIADFSLPYIKTIKCLYLPPDEYAAIPDSLIRELPFKL